MLTRFAKQLGIEEPAPEREALLAEVYERLAIIREDGRHAVLIIDDAQALASPETLAEVCGLLKLEYEDRRLLSLVLAGDARARRGARERSGAGAPGRREGAHGAARPRDRRRLPRPPRAAGRRAIRPSSRPRPSPRSTRSGAGMPGPDEHPGRQRAVRGLPLRSQQREPRGRRARPPRSRLGAARRGPRTAPADVTAPRLDEAPAPQPARTAAAELEILDPLDSELEAVFEVATSEPRSSGSPTPPTRVPVDGPPKEDDPEDFLIELLED